MTPVEEDHPHFLCPCLDQQPQESKAQDFPVVSPSPVPSQTNPAQDPLDDLDPKMEKDPAFLSV